MTGVFETEKPETSTKNDIDSENKSSKKRNLKKLTWVGRLSLVTGLLLGLGGIFQTFNEDKSNEEKTKQAKEKYKNDRFLDSIKFANKYYLDSVNFINLNSELKEASENSDRSKVKIIENAINLSTSALNSINESKHPIPNRFIINLESELDIPKIDEIELDNLVRFYNFNFEDKGARGFSLSDENYKYFNNETLQLLHSFRYSDIDYEINFYKGKSIILSIRDFNTTNLNNYKTKNFKNTPAGLRNEVKLFYNPKIKKFTMDFSQVETEAKTYINSNSLLNLKNCTIKIRLFAHVYSKSGKSTLLVSKKINRLSIATPENLFLGFDNLNKKDNNGRFVISNLLNEWK